MACNLTYTEYANRPRIMCRDTDKAAITTKTNSASAWKTEWDGVFGTAVGSAIGASDASISTSQICDAYMLALGLWGWIENSTAAHNKLLSAARYLAQTTSIWSTNVNTRRVQCYGLCYAYDFLRTGVITFSDTDRRIIGTGMLAISNRTYSEAEFMDGHSQANMAPMICCAICLLGEYGTGFDFRTTAVTRLDYAAGFYYGDTPGDECHLDVQRYQCSDGGYFMGATYSHIRWWANLHVLQAVHNGLVRNADTPGELLLNGEEYAPFDDETWVAKIGEFCINMYTTGYTDCWGINDTAKITTPVFHNYERYILCMLAKYGGAWRKQMLWLRNRLDTWEESIGSGRTDLILAHDILLTDPSSSDETATHPMSASPAISKTSWMNPPGLYLYRNTWDYDQGCAVLIDCQERYNYGHNHLSAGGIQINVRDDMVLLDSGCYDAFHGGEGTISHHQCYYQESIAHSGVPLIDDGVTTHEGKIYTNYPDTSTEATVTLPSGLGGQLFKKFGTVRDPENMTQLLTDGGGLAWKRCTPTLRVEAATYDFLTVDARYAYVQYHTQIGTTAERVRKCNIRYLIIKNESAWPIIFRVVEIEKRLGSFTCRDHWHSWNNWSQTYPHSDASGQGDTRRHAALGSLGTGQVIIDQYNWRDFTAQIVGDGPVNSQGYGSSDFAYNRVNYPPYAWSTTETHNWRETRDLGRYRLEFVSTIERVNEYFVELIMPMGAGDSPVSYQWIDEPLWFGVQFSASNQSYRIAKTEDRVEIGSSVSSPPGAPTGLAATPGDQQVSLTWTPNSEAGMYGYRLYYREKAV